jgi:hypothetical protein
MKEIMTKYNDIVEKVSYRLPLHIFILIQGTEDHNETTLPTSKSWFLIFISYFYITFGTKGRSTTVQN